MTIVPVHDEEAFLDNAIFGYHDRWAEQIVEDNASAGENILWATAVPAGEIWHLEKVALFNANTALSYYEVRIESPLALMRLVCGKALAASTWVTSSESLTLREGDQAYVAFGGCTAGDTLIAQFWGRKMKVA